MRWMQDGLPLLGERTTVRWLGSTAVEMAIPQGKAPFAGVTLVIFLEPRDLPWMWAIGRAQRRRDTLIIRGVLRQAPKVEFEALDAATWSGREALARVPTDWPVRQVEGSAVVHHASAAALQQADALLQVAQRAGLTVKRLSLRRSEPHFQLHVPAPDPRQRAHDFFTTVRALAECAAA
jgi:hypothetical protein